jgi:ABC-type maltose transport system permease subunit
MGMRSTHEAALTSDGRWLRHLFHYRDTWILVLVFAVTQLLDAATTAYALSTGRFSEANPVLGHLLTTNPLIGYLFKVAIAGLVLMALLLMRLRWRMRRMVLALFAITSLVAPIANVLRITGHL